MAYQEVTTTGYGTRVGNSFKAIGSGFLLFIAGTALLQMLSLALVPRLSLSDVL